MEVCRHQPGAALAAPRQARRRRELLAPLYAWFRKRRDARPHRCESAAGGAVAAHPQQLLRGPTGRVRCRCWRLLDGRGTFASCVPDFPFGALSDTDCALAENSLAESTPDRKPRPNEIRKITYFRPDSFSLGAHSATTDIRNTDSGPTIQNPHPTSSSSPSPSACASSSLKMSALVPRRSK